MRRGKPALTDEYGSEIKTLRLIGGEVDYCEKLFGYERRGGSFRSSYSPILYTPRCTIPSVIECRYMPELGYSVFLNSGGHGYTFNESTGLATDAGSVNSSTPFVVAVTQSNAPAYAMYGNKKVVYMRAGASTAANVAYSLACGTMHCGRIFARDAADPYLIRWSGLNFTDWSNGNFNNAGNLRVAARGGAIIKILNYGDNLLIVRMHGISILHALGDARHFRLEVGEDYNFVGNVTAPTVAQCGGKVYFACGDKLYYYAQGRITPVTLDSMTEGYSFESISAFDDNVLYIGAVKGSERVLISYSVTDGACALFGYGCRLPFRTATAFYCFKGDDLIKLYSGVNDENRIWRSRPIDLGTRNVKRLKKITADCGANVSFKVTAGGLTLTYTGSGEHAVELNGTEFIFETGGRGDIKSLSAEWEVRK